ncbi:hypothetical protein LCGC14_1224560 [marine sediment metagenome]|uniref:Uncharacterized protein n=1 Tax=marine sediment metagenome TaxID=412755 RepID=A0A0F9PER4_9ZZZZ
MVGVKGKKDSGKRRPKKAEKTTVIESICYHKKK